MTKIICELGQNFEGDKNLAKYMIQECAPFADIIKLQFWNVEGIYRPDDVRYEPTKSRALLFEDIMDLVALIKHLKRIPCVSCFGVRGDEYRRLYDAGVLVKYASSEFDVFREHAQIYPQNKIASLGHYDGKIQDLPRGNVVYLACDAHYPSIHYEEALLQLGELAKEGYLYGLSDHSIGLNVAKAAVLMGAYCIEKHYTTEEKQRTSSFRDHKCSMIIRELSELKEFITAHDLATKDEGFIRKDAEGFRRIKRVN